MIVSGHQKRSNITQKKLFKKIIARHHLLDLLSLASWSLFSKQFLYLAEMMKPTQTSRFFLRWHQNIKMIKRPLQAQVPGALINHSFFICRTNPIWDVLMLGYIFLNRNFLQYFGPWHFLQSFQPCKRILFLLKTNKNFIIELAQKKRTLVKLTQEEESRGKYSAPAWLAGCAGWENFLSKSSERVE